MSKWFARLHFLLLSFNMYANAVSPVLTLCVGLHSQEHIPITAAHLLLRSAFEETAFETLRDGGAREKGRNDGFSTLLGWGGWRSREIRGRRFKYMQNCLLGEREGGELHVGEAGSVFRMLFHLQSGSLEGFSWRLGRKPSTGNNLVIAEIFSFSADK